MSLSNLRVLNDAQYANLRYQVIKLLEGARSLPYFDSNGYVTIGIGFNINTNNDNRTGALAAMGITGTELTTMNTAFASARMAEIRSMPASTQAQRDARDLE
jgi:GH24 family phage-related lysozyme (muramidase)